MRAIKDAVACHFEESERHGEAGNPKTTYTILPEEKLSTELQVEISKLTGEDGKTVLSPEAVQLRHGRQASAFETPNL